MISLADFPLTLLADASAASSAMRMFIMPTVFTLAGIASLVCTFFLVNGGVQYMTSSGNPAKLENAKKILKNALLGLVLVIAAVTLTAILSHAYNGTNKPIGQNVPTIQEVKTGEMSLSVEDVIAKAVTRLFEKVVQSIGKPFLESLQFFTDSTPLMGDNSGVFNLWVVMVGIADVLFILVVALLGFHVMSFSTFGFEELDLKQLLPQFALAFLLINTSIFAIDGVISLSNAMIHAIRAGFPDSSIWEPLIAITVHPGLSLGGLLVLVAFLVISVILLVYYVLRLVMLYLGAVLAPLIILLWLLPAFKDFAITALKVYLTTIFVLCVHVIILMLASSIFAGVNSGDSPPNTITGLIIGLATLMALLKTQGLMQQLSYAASTPRAARTMAHSVMQGTRYTMKNGKTNYKTGATVLKSIRSRLTGRTLPADNKGQGGQLAAHNQTASSVAKANPNPPKKSDMLRAKKSPKPEK